MCTLLISPVAADDDFLDSYEPYLGLAVPVVEVIPSMPPVPEEIKRTQSGFHEAILLVDRSGRVKKTLFPTDSAVFFQPLLQVWKDIRFRFLDGVELETPVKVPVILEYMSMRRSMSIRIRFPIVEGVVSDERLMNRFFDLNEIVPPRLVDMPAVDYLLDSQQKENDYISFLAQIDIDTTGAISDLKFSIRGKHDLTHQVLVALINADIKPATIHGRPFPTQLLLVFRIFDNIHYPFSPTEPFDSLSRAPYSEKYFMSICHHLADCRLNPIPRHYASGEMPNSSKETGIVSYFTEVIIDTTGEVSPIMPLRGSSSSKIGDHVARLLRLTNWYPAKDEFGQKRKFSGIIRLEFRDGRRVVYTPEWLSP